MVSRTVKIENAEGLHMRPAGVVTSEPHFIHAELMLRA